MPGYHQQRGDPEPAAHVLVSDGMVMVRLTGAVDRITGTRAAETLLTESAYCAGTMVVDLSGVTSFGPAMIALLAHAARATLRRGGRFRVIVPSPTRRVPLEPPRQPEPRPRAGTPREPAVAEARHGRRTGLRMRPRLTGRRSR